MPNRLRGIFLVPFFIFTLFASAQINTVSPYSRLGLGDVASPDFARSMGFGGANLGMVDPLNINLNNPASYSALELTTFEVGLQFSFLEQVQETPAYNLNNSSAGLRYFAVGVPLYEWWGSAVVLKPYSFKGYNISSSRRISAGGTDSLTITDRSQGSGGLTEVVWGNSFEVAKGLSLGINSSFIFGKLEESNSTIFNGIDLPYDTKSVYADIVRGFAFEAGAQYQYNFSNKRSLSIGATFSNATTLDAKTNRTVYTYASNASGRELPIDSLTLINSRASNYTLPGTFGVGISYAKQTEYTLGPAWGVNADFEQISGSQFRDAYGNSQGLRDGFNVQAGTFFTPRYAFKKLERSNQYWSIVEYRVGGFYEQTPISVRGTGINDYGITLGLGLPIRQRSLAPGEVKASTINMGVILGRRGTLSNGLIQENYLNLYLGVTLNDKWFIKYKYR
jgi:hypothetical protein